MESALPSGVVFVVVVLAVPELFNVLAVSVVPVVVVDVTVVSEVVSEPCVLLSLQDHKAAAKKQLANARLFFIKIFFVSILLKIHATDALFLKPFGEGILAISWF